MLCLSVARNEVHEDDPLFCARFNPNYQNWYLLGMCNEIGHLNVYNTKRAEVNVIKLSTSICFHKNAIFDFAWCPDIDLKVLIASADESISYSDVETGKTLSTFLGHRGSVRAISWCKENPSLFTSAGRDGHLLVWDLRRSERTAAIIVQNAHLDLKKKNGLTQPICAVFHRCQRYVLSAGYAESGIRVWDLRKIRLVSRSHCRPSAVWPYSPFETDRWQRQYGFTSISSDPTNKFVFVPCTDGTIYQYSALRLDPEPINRFVGATIRTYYVYPTVCPFAPFLACGSENGQTLIWNYEKWNSPMYTMDGHRVGVCSVSWNIYGQLVTCSDDPSWRIWAPCWDAKLVKENRDYCSVRQLKFDSDRIVRIRMKTYRFRSRDQLAGTTPEGHRGRAASKSTKLITVNLESRRALTLDKLFGNPPNSSNTLQASNINLPDSSESMLLSSMEECPGSSQSTASRPRSVRRCRTSILDYFTRS
ncbi:Denticleless protein homolog [Trichuris trichiura]|uniref:Denticleless protein homolog n=1 Tax=Trichuris trichiura TaxID=36087 RepID=A0A077Z990_TRITR|nr:Denticleless protein homolog [Trichuris trichiura]